MHARYAERGLRILAFPSNQFANQVNECFTFYKHDILSCMSQEMHFTPFNLLHAYAMLTVASLDVFYFEGARH